MARALSFDGAIDLLDDLLDEFIMPGFQKKLWEVFVEAGDDEAEKEKVVAEMRAPIEGPILAKHGYESVAQALATLSEALVADEEIERRYVQMAVLLSPALQYSGEQPPPLRAVASAAPRPSRPAGPAPASSSAPARRGGFTAAAEAAAVAAELPAEAAEPEEHFEEAESSPAAAAQAESSPAAAARAGAVPQLWRVVGGAAQGGIMVRSKESLFSELLKPRLSKGAVVEELTRNGDRLQYRRVSGDGPETGWVSVTATGKVLLEPCF